MNLLDNILLGIALAAALTILWLGLANAHLRADLAEARGGMTACQMANDEFRQKTEQQNRTVLALQSQTEALRHKAASAAQALEKTAAGYEDAAQKLAREKAEGDDCRATSALIDRVVEAMR